MSKDCLTSCYHKYINVLDKLRSLSIKKGDKFSSEFILKGFNPRFDEHEDFLFPKGGTQFSTYYNSTKIVEFYKIYPIKGFSPYRVDEENQ
jgi:hypothetical protein